MNLLRRYRIAIIRRAGVVALLACFVQVWPAAMLTLADAQAALLVRLDSGLLTVDASTEPLKEVLLQVGKASGIEVVLVGDFDMPVTMAFSGLPPAEGIRLLAGDHSTALLHKITGDAASGADNREIARIWVINSTPGSHDDAAEPAQASAAPEPEPAPATDGMTPPDEFAYPDDLPAGRVIEQLDRYDETTVVSILHKILSEEQDVALRLRAISELEQIGSESATEALGAGLGGDESSLRLRTVESLSALDNPQAIRLLGQALIGDPQPDVRMAAVQALALHSGEVPRSFLEAAVDDGDQAVSHAARQALQGYAVPQVEDAPTDQ